MNSTDIIEENTRLRRELSLTQEKLKTSERKLQEVVAGQHSSINQDKRATSLHGALDYLSVRVHFWETVLICPVYELASFFVRGTQAIYLWSRQFFLNF